MTTKRMKSTKARRDWAEVLQHVRQGGTIIVEHYNTAVAVITPYEESEDGGSKIIPQISHSDPAAGATPDP